MDPGDQAVLDMADHPPAPTTAASDGLESAITIYTPGVLCYGQICFDLTSLYCDAFIIYVHDICLLLEYTRSLHFNDFFCVSIWYPCHCIHSFNKFNFISCDNVISKVGFRNLRALFMGYFCPLN